MIAFLKALSPKAWLIIALLAGFAVYTGAVYRAGGAGPRADLIALQNSVKQAREAQVKEDAKREGQHRALIKEKDREREQAIADNTLAWDSYVVSLQSAPSRAKRDKKPVRIAVQRCNNAAGNDAVSAAISEFRNQTRSAIADFQDETGDAVAGFRNKVAGQLKGAQVNTDQLIRLQDTLKREQQINKP